MTDLIRNHQQILDRAGYDPGPVDGVWGPMTEAASRAFIAARGTARASGLPHLPWIEEMLSVFGLHEARDNARLRAWLKSDGATLGNPAGLPWCGDAVETAIRNAIPDEPFTGDLKANPYWARNWLGFGVICQPVYGAVAVFERGSGGHVGFIVGQDARSWHVLGGNQGDKIGVTAIDKRRLLGCRWPRTVFNPNLPAPVRAAIAQSVNEV